MFGLQCCYYLVVREFTLVIKCIPQTHYYAVNVHDEWSQKSTKLINMSHFAVPFTNPAH